MAKRHTKLLAFMLVLSILASIPAFAANTPRATPGGSDISQEIASKYFEDVFGDGAEEVDYLYEHHIVTGAWQPKGDTLGYFGTDYTLYRGLFVKLLSSYLKLPGGSRFTFSDVSEGSYYAEGVAKAAEAGLIPDAEDGFFRPEEPITIQEAAAIFYLAVQKGLMDVVLLPGDGWELQGSNTAAWAKDAMQAMIASGVIAAGTAPDQPMTWLDSAKLTAKFMQTDLTEQLPPELFDEVLVVVHTNDTHGYVQNEARVKAIADYYKGLYGENVITMSAGNIYAGGAAIAHYYKGEKIREIMESAGYDYVTPGNNDFNLEDKTPGQNEILAQEASYKTLAANLYCEEDGVSTGRLVFPRGEVLTTTGGTKVGIFGLALLGRQSDTYFQSDDLETAKDMVSMFKELDCGVIMALGHKGWKGEPDGTSAEEQDGEMAVDYGSAVIADQTDGLDALIDGHSHSIINDGSGWISPNTGCMVTQAGEKGNVVGVMKLYLKDGHVEKAVADLIDEAQLPLFDPDPQTQAVVDAANAQFDDDTKLPVGETPYNLNAARLSGNNDLYGIRTDETNMGDLCADALAWQLQADVAVMAAGGIRASIPEGEITLGDWFSVFAIGGSYTVSDITGQELLEALASPLSDLPQESPGFIQVSGIKFGFVVGDGMVTILNPTVGGVPLDVKKTYRVAQMSTEESETEDSISGMDALADMMVDYLSNDDYTIYPDVPRPDERMVQYDAVPEGATAYEVEVTQGMMRP